ncbi:ADP-ribose pyrophosphatase YjhB, NUDIX family [Catalinimonas alkaloidigena]|uniref:ADP-ribose pyrophosphatase YjhB, NUDIX family n=1 Tax=Catalinimonas alkaloidigena TaxID=1075417 RepID=A0A1G9P912_9BACT|nr:NUDIX hydrolase [Catalinimonas alkaloidigena]SDL94645.1 ADP-ribose pyrophosphatase YjhB, NUDIX family [Catalinimonas alkaloidigena]
MLDLIKQVQAIAQAGLHYGENDYDLDRYQRLNELTQQMFNAWTGTAPEFAARWYEGEIGYPTPKVDVRAVVMRDGKMLLVREKIDGCWSLPGGWADVGCTVRETAEKETWEEAGLRVKAQRLLAVFDKKCHPHPPEPWYVYKHFVLCDIATGEGDGQAGMETLDVGFFGPNELPPLSVDRNTASQVHQMFTLATSVQPTIFD